MTSLDLQNILCVAMLGQALWPVMRRRLSKKRRNLDRVMARYLAAYCALQPQDNPQHEASYDDQRLQGSVR